MFRTTLTDSRIRRCSGAVVAAATAALVLTPGVASAADQPAGPGGGGHSVSHHGGHSGHATGHATGHAGAGRSTSHRSGRAAGSHTGTHTAGHTAGHSGTHGAKATGHGTRAGTASHRATSASHKTGSASGTDASGAPDSSGHGSTGPQHPGSKTSSSDQTATVTRLSVSKTVAEDGTLTMIARVSPAHRGAGGSPATGSVVFSVDGASSEPIPLSGGRAMVQAEVGPGEHTATARYGGDAEHAPSESEPVTVAAD